MEKNLNILIQSSEYYAPFAGVMLTSLFENNKGQELITVYLMTSDMSEKNRERFQILAEQYQREIKFINTKEIDFFLENNQAPKHNGAYTTYYKIFALSVIEDEIDRLIYLDSDMLVTGSLSELLTWNLGENVLGMCIDAIPSRYKKIIKYNSQFYYNAGMIVFDCKKWKQNKSMDKVIEHMTNVHAAYPLVDQDLLNIVFSTQIVKIPLKYNCYPIIFLYNDYTFLKKAYGILNFYTEVEVMSAKQDAAILHCIEAFGLRPWHEGEHPYKEIWGEYLKISPWDDFIFFKHDVSEMSRIQRFLFKYAPRDLFSIINRNCVYVLLSRKARKLGLNK